jgi:hypothetical protein
MCDARRSVRDMIADDSHQRKKVRTGMNHRISNHHQLAKSNAVKSREIQPVVDEAYYHITNLL